VSERADRGTDFWARAWLALTSNWLLVVWVGLLAFSGVIALWFPQVPRSAYTQERGLERWLTGIRPELGSPTDVLLAVGLLSVERSVWFRVIVAGIGFSLILRTIDSLTLFARPGGRPPEHFLAQTLFLPMEIPAALATVKTYVRDGLEINSEDEEGYRLSACRPLAPLGPLLVGVGGLILIGGWIWTQIGGWQASDLFVTDRIPATLTEAGGTLTLEDLEVAWQDSSTVEQAHGRLRFADDREERSGEIGLDSPWRWRSTTYDLTNVGPAVHVTGTGPGGRPLQLQVAASRPAAEQITLALPADDNLRSFAAPEQGIVVQVEAVTGQPSPAIHLRVYLGQAGQLVEDRVTDARAFILIDGTRLSLSVIPFAQITASHTPGRPLAVSGIVLIVTGALLALAYPRQELRVEAETEEDGTRLTLAVSGGNESQWLAIVTQHLAGEERGNDEH
jgi:hypothetical protein